MTKKYYQSSEKDDWETPQALYDKLKTVFWFVIDGACTPENKKCSIGSYKDDEIDWYSTTFCNPPYGTKNLEYFFKKAIKARDNGVDVVMLIPSSTEIDVWFKYIWDEADYIIFPKGRLKHEINGVAKGSATKGSAIVVYSYSDSLYYYNQRFKKLEALNIGKVINPKFTV